jgi:hypothetical protein
MNGELASIIIIIFFIAGSIWLQIFFSKRGNKWLGLIIPLISFMFSLLVIFGHAIFTAMTTTSTAEISNGAVVKDIYVTSQLGSSGIISTLVRVVPIFLISNIPTVIYLGIYFACREKIKLRSELDKMNIQDLG